MNRKYLITAAACALIAIGALISVAPWPGGQAVAADTSTMTRPEIEAIIHDYLMDNPQVIIDAVNKLATNEKENAERVAEAFLEDNREAIENAPGAFIAGNPNGDVTIVEFFDYHCGYCKKSLAGLMKTVNDDKNIKLVLREFPVLGPDSVFAAKAALASIKQGKYMELHEEMMEAKGKLTRSRIETMAISVGIDLIELNESLITEDHAKLLADNLDMAQGLGINGTPSFVLGGKIHHGMRSGEDLRALVAEARGS
jgi:protein-disulfide isomerase